MTKNEIEQYMSLAIEQAELAMSLEEIPVGAILVKGTTIFHAHNFTSNDRNSLEHAEMKVIAAAQASTKDMYLNGWTLFATLEPCPMCAGAIWLSRLDSVYFGAYDSKAGACGSVLNVIPNSRLNHLPKVYGGIMEQTCADLLKDFFLNKRIRNGQG